MHSVVGKYQQETKKKKKVEVTAGTRSELSHDFPVSGGKKNQFSFKAKKKIYIYIFQPPMLHTCTVDFHSNSPQTETAREKH